ncbi:MAG: AAA family ATPase [Nitrospinota bacterium]
MEQDIISINERVKEKSAFVDIVLSESAKVVVGQRYVIERMLIAMLCRGHILLEGVPGLGKTLLIKTLSETVRTGFKRVQFTPDLLPADLIGTLIYDAHKACFTVRKGPIFTNIVLADEINRAPAKVQSALLEAMQERQVTIGDETYPLDSPFMVLATQNPIEQEGTYPLPEAQVDRFIFKLNVTHPEKEDEIKIIRRMSVTNETKVQEVISPSDIVDARKVIDEIYIDDKIVSYVVDIVNATRKPKESGLDSIHEFIEFGASPRASLFMVMAAKAHAFLRHRGYVTPDDVKAVGVDVLRHRVILGYEADAENVTCDEVVQAIFNGVSVP